MRRLVRFPPAALPRASARKVAGAAASIAAFALAVLIAGPIAFGYRHYVVTGGSMEPTIPLGSLVLTRPVPVADLKAGDVITYVPPSGSGVSGPVTHRIVSIDRDERGARVFRTRGDANASADPWTFTLDRRVQPRVAFHVPVLGQVFALLAAPAGRLGLIGLPAALIGVLSLRDLFAVIRARRRPRAGTWAGEAA